MSKFKRFIKSLFIVCFASFSFASLAHSASKDAPVSVGVSLSPMGSFTVTSARIFGKGKRKGDIYIGKNIRVPVSMLKTGIGLRDNHLKKKLEYKKHKYITAHKIKAKGSKGVALIEIKGKKKLVRFKFEDLGENKAKAKFKLSLKDFGISGISYQGVGVEDQVDVTVILPYNKIESKSDKKAEAQKVSVHNE